MKVTFWGTRGSIPAPLKPKEVQDKIVRAIAEIPDVYTGDAESVRDHLKELSPLLFGTAGGNTPCVAVQAGEEIIVIDAGTGLHELGLEMVNGPCGQGEGLLHLLISHLHWDHIQGFPMFRPAFVPGNQIVIYGIHDVEAAFVDQQQLPTWPVSLHDMGADIQFVRLQEGQEFGIGDVRITTICNTHRSDSYSYRLEHQGAVLVYASDAEYKQLDDASVHPHIEFFRNADALIFDAQYTLQDGWDREDWGHSSAMIGIDLARAAGVKRLLLFHHDPTYPDDKLQKIWETAVAYQAADTSRPTCEVIMACEGLTLNLVPPSAVDLRLTARAEAAILTPSYVFDEFGVQQIAQRLAELDASNPSSVIDLSSVETLTTASLKALVTLSQERDGAPIVLAAPSDSVRQVIRLGGYVNHFAIYPSVEAALSAVWAREALNLPGQVLKERYQIEGKMGEGRLGAVLKAVDIQTNQPVVLKVFSAAVSPELVARCARQIQQIVGWEHPNIVRVIDWDAEGFRAESFVAGKTLRQHLADVPLPLANDPALEIIRGIASALDYAHRRGVIHSNLRPANVLLTEEGVKLCDFGLGCLEEGRNFFHVPILFLTASYLAPEQIVGQPLDARTDLYSMGVILYQLLTGRLPFEGDEQAILHAQVHDSPPPPRELNPEISLSLEHLVLKLLAKNPNDRYASAQQVHGILDGLSGPMGDAADPQRQHVAAERQEQLQALADCWQKARAGQGRLVFITGESGIGKTTLAQQAALWSQAPVQLTGVCQEIQGAPPYHLFSQIIKGYLATVPPELSDEQNCRLLSHFMSLVPEIRHMLPHLADPPPLDPEQEQLRLMASLTQFIGRATKERPWFLILDDLQWADPNSLELLRYLGRHLPSMALLVVGTYRDTELGRDHPLRETLRDLSNHPTYRHLPLGRLGQESVRSILSNIWQPDVPGSLIESIYHHTGGNPLYVKEVARGLMDDGLVKMDRGGWRFPDLAEIRLPASVREAVWHRIGHLSPDTQTLLSQAAVLGQTFSFAALQEMSGLSEWQVLEHLDVMMERQLVQEVPGDAMLCFRHTEIQQVLYADLGPLRRRILHQQAGMALERYAALEPERIAEQLAYHFSQAGEVERAVVYGLEAARQAQAAYANEVALSRYRQTLELFHQLKPAQAPAFQFHRMVAHQSLGEVLLLVGRYAEALEHFAAARALFETPPPSTDAARRLADLCRLTAQAYEGRSEYERAFEWLEKGMSYLDAEKPTAELMRLYNRAGWTRLRQDDFAAAQTWLKRAMDLAHAAGFQQVEANSMRALGIVSWRQGNYVQAIEYCEEGLRIYRETGDRQGEAASLNNLGVVYVEWGHFSQALDYYQQAIEINREIGDRLRLASGFNNMGVISWLMGDNAAALDYHEQARQLFREIGHREGEAGLGLNNLGVVLQSTGNYVQAREYTCQALETCREIGYRRGEGMALHNLGVISRHLGDYASAREYHQQALCLWREVGDRPSESESLGHLGLLDHLSNDHRAARERIQQSLQLAQELGGMPKQAQALTFLGHAWAGLAAWEEALAAYQQALDLRRELGQPHAATEPLAGLAAVLLARGDLSSARSHVEEILCHLEHGSLEGTEEPFRTYLACYRVLDAAQDPRAAELLATAHSLLQEWAGRIQDQEIRRSFLDNVAVHRAIVRAFERSHQHP
ncbi:MAG: tetratricopeptide repeat protein [Anaerolineae bacterium]|nr:tetratricopeptide repeat protein [Anaerolineae bacterium]